MENLGVIPIEKIDDISALDQYQVCLDAGYTKEKALKIVSLYNRDNARTPVQWNDEKNAGFTTGIPWLMVQSTMQINVNCGKQTKLHCLPFIKR